MPVAIAEVPVWYVDGGIGHAVGSINDGFILLGCRSLVSGNVENTTRERPKRVCRACREALKAATITTPREGKR